ncbi:MAG TPA: glucose-6-phosphate isomerase [Mycobacteriales bacterium]|nr:glucose-6-phosphate isomerase [Mycobacteriales bacterium]
MNKPATASAGGVSVRVAGTICLPSYAATLARATADEVAGRLSRKDTTLWGAAAAAEAAVRLGWLDVAAHGRALLPAIEELRTALAAEGVTRVVLCGMGGSSLAPEVICAAAGQPLVVVDSTDPAQVNAALIDLPRTVVVVSSKSGGTVETDSHRRAARAAFAAAGIDPAQRVVVVTDPGSPLAAEAAAEGSRAIFLADPNVGGRYSALTAFGLVPAGLAGVDVAALLTDAEAMLPSLEGADNPALLLGCALGAGGRDGRDKVVLAPASEPLPGFGDWAEQLVAESTGKNGTGLLPVVVEGAQAPGTEMEGDTHLVSLGSSDDVESTCISGPLGAQFLAWEYATAVACWALEVNPFDQPNVQESKDITGAILRDGPGSTPPPTLSDQGVEVYLPAGADPARQDLAAVLTWLLAAVPGRGYLAVMAYLDRAADARLVALRSILAGRTDHPVTFGWAPRFLHSTGQFHKGGPPVGVFLQITGATETDLVVPGRPYSFAELQAAQALGDLRALTERDRPVVRMHLTNRGPALDALLAAAAG